MTDAPLELNEKSVAEAVTGFIHHKVQELTVQKKYDDHIRDAFSHHLLPNAHGTFLWVALVCEELAKSTRWNTRRPVTTYPPGLNALYERMIERILDPEDAELCKRILGVVLASYRPVTLDELSFSVNIPDGVSDEGGFLTEMIEACGSFLTVRDRPIFFVHQSAKRLP